MCAPKSSPYWKSNSSWPDFSTGIAVFSPRAFACGMIAAPNCSSTSTPRVDASAPPVSTAFTMPS